MRSRVTKTPGLLILVRAVAALAKKAAACTFALPAVKTTGGVFWWRLRKAVRSSERGFSAARSSRGKAV